MTEQTNPRNRYVLRTESGHPGFKNAVILATSPDLLKLSEDIRALSERGIGRVEHYVTEEKNPNSLGSVVFQVISDGELEDLQRESLKEWFSRKFGCTLLLLFLLCTFYGAYTIIRNVFDSIK
jgi:hypothetical protein